MNFNFKQISTRVNIRRALDKYLSSDVPRPTIISDDLNEVFFPLKFLPVVALDKSTDDGLVMVKGTILSMIGQIEVNNSSTTYRFPIGTDTGTTYDTGIANIPISENMYTGNTNTISTSNSYWGYPDDHIGVVVPANGGSNVTYSYTTYDEDLGTYKPDGSEVSDATSDDITIAANRPLGIAMTHIMQDSRGKYLNYYNPTNKAFAVHTKGYARVPFINWPKIVDDGASGILEGSTSDDFVDYTTSAGTSAYDAIKSLYAFAYINDYQMGANTISNGTWVISDTYGRFSVDIDATTFTNQTVGKFIALDSRLPKDLMEYVDGPIQSGLTGTNTGGIEKTLFLVASTVMRALNDGTAPTIAEVVDAVQAGYFGEATILIMLS